MKRTILFLISMVIITSVKATPIDPQRAMQVALQFVPVSESAAQAPAREEVQPVIVYTHPMPKSGQPAFYVVNVDGAFVLVSADDIAHPILGYNFGNNWPSHITELPTHIKSFFDDLAAQMEAAKEAEPNMAPSAEWTSSQMSPHRRAITELPDSVGPLLTTTWDQGQYYNSFCPEDQNSPNAGHCPTGCVATAMAQIINYWGQQTPIKTRGIHSYDSNYGTLTVNYDSAQYDFTHMPDALTSTSTQQEIDAVANLMRDCGVAVNMEYSPWESGAFSVNCRAGLINYFNYNSYASLVSRDGFVLSDWKDLLQNELENNCPIVYSGSGTGSHAFICDGYNDDYFHFNFGWSGFGDGWYLLSTITPNINDFSSSQCAIIGLYPKASENNNAIIGQSSGIIVYENLTDVDFLHIYGHNMYDYHEGIASSNVVTFKLTDTTKHIVLDVINLSEGWALDVYNGSTTRTDSLIQTLVFDENMQCLSPIIASSSVTIAYSVFVTGTANKGFQLHISEGGDCRMVSCLKSVVDSTNVQISWAENGTATQWEIEYGKKNHILGDGSVINVNSLQYSLTGLQPFTEYEIYVRPICGGNWNGPISCLVGASSWIESVQEEPVGYSVRDNNVYISSPEGLAWWAKKAIVEEDVLRNVFIISDIDLEGKQWIPIENYYGNINGTGHIIKNMKILEPSNSAAFIRNFTNGTIENIGFNDFYVNGKQGIASIVASLDQANVKNCFAQNGQLYGQEIGGIVSHAFNSTIINCFSDNVEWFGFGYNSGIVGYTERTIIKNCYSSSKGEACPLCINGGVVGYTQNSNISNCYCIEQPFNSSRRGFVVGVMMEGNNIKDTTTIEDNIVPVLHDSIRVDDIWTSDLLTALNLVVNSLGDTSLKLWETDSISSYPILADYYSNTCVVVRNISAKNVEINQRPMLKLSWESEADSFVVRCIPLSDAETIYLCTKDSFVFYEGLTLGEQYTFNIRAICDSLNHSGWGYPTTHIFDKVYWEEIVTSQPNGYVVDTNSNIWISTEEGLAWFVQESSNCPPNIDVHLLNDLNISQYKWKPNGIYNCTFYGHNHVIEGLYAREDSYASLFGGGYNVKLLDIRVGGDIYVTSMGGGLFNDLTNSFINNCHSAVNIHSGGDGSGSLGCTLNYSEIINCSASGDVIGNCVNGGLLSQAIHSKIINCYASGDVSIDRTSGYRFMHRGGLIGYMSDSTSVKNSYSTGHVDFVDFEIGSLGSAIGFAYPCIITNTYALQDTNGLWVHGFYPSYTYPIEQYHDNTFFDETGRLTTIIYVNGDIDTIMVHGEVYDNLLDALNAWVDANDTASIYCHWAADMDSVNNGFPIFAPIPKFVVTFLNSDSSLLQCDTLEYGSMPVYRGEGPFKPMEGIYFFVFTGWEPNVVTVTGDAIYIATYESHGTGVAIPDETKQPLKIWHNGHLYILLPDGTRFDSTGKRVE